MTRDMGRTNNDVILHLPGNKTTAISMLGETAPLRSIIDHDSQRLFVHEKDTIQGVYRSSPVRWVEAYGPHEPLDAMNDRLYRIMTPEERQHNDMISEFSENFEMVKATGPDDVRRIYYFSKHFDIGPGWMMMVKGENGITSSFDLRDLVGMFPRPKGRKHVMYMEHDHGC